jgi:pimeloyl-ACP methyl ester carboxylesterase
VQPFFFGDSARQLFGAWDPALVRSDRGAVICHPWAREYLLAYPTLRQLALRLAGAGLHTLRFDYTGTGDSADGDEDADFGQWTLDVRAAMDELREVAQVRTMTLIGMRLGAALATRAVAGRADVERLVLWDPVCDGRAYLDSLGAAQTADGGDVAGAVLTSRLRRGIEAVVPADFAAALPRTLVIDTGEAAGGCDEVARLLASGGTERLVERISDVRVWREEWGRGGVGLGMNAVNRIVEWLSGQ